jgi:hypothetical protein
MNKKGISMLVIVAIIVIAVVVGGIAAYYVLTSGEGGEPVATPTPSSSPDVEGATSISFDVALAEETDKFTAKNLGTSDVLLRVDQKDAEGNTFIYLMNQTGQEAWANFGGEWMDVSATFEADYWNSPLIGKVALDSYMTALADWSGTGDYEGDGFTITSITVNPAVEDSAFEPSS